MIASSVYGSGSKTNGTHSEQGGTLSATPNGCHQQNLR